MFLSTLCTLKTNLSALCMTLCLIEAERINMAISTTPCITQAVGCPESPPVYQHCVKCGIRAECCSRSGADSAMPRGVTAPLLLLSVSSGPALLSAAWLQLMFSWHFTCSLSEWGYVSYSLMYLLCQTMLIEWAIWQNTWRVPSASSLQQLWEKMDIATGTQQSGENLDVVGLSPPSSLGDAKMQRRAGAIFSLFCMCAEFRHKSPVLRANRVRTLCASYNFALLPHSSKGFITSHCLWTVQSIKVDLCSVDAPHCLLELETLSAHCRV